MVSSKFNRLNSDKEKEKPKTKDKVKEKQKKKAGFKPLIQLISVSSSLSPHSQNSESESIKL